MHATLHARDSRGKTNMGWLNSAHTFSFGHFQDPSRMGFRSLRVINDDRIIGGSGFPSHPHSNMEIITIVLEGALEHKDSMGNGSIIKAGDIQKMSAGSGVTHSEFNASKDEPCHFYQIWIIPDAQNIAPSYEQIALDKQGNPSKGFRLIGDRVASDDKISIHQDAKLYFASLQDDEEIHHDLDTNRYGFLQILQGSVDIEGETLKEGDGLEFSGKDMLSLKANSASKVLLFDLE